MSGINGHGWEPVNRTGMQFLHNDFLCFGETDTNYNGLAGKGFSVILRR